MSAAEHEVARLGREVHALAGGDDPSPGEVALAWLAAAGAIVAPGPRGDLAPSGYEALDLDRVDLEPAALARLGPSTCAFLDLVPVRREGEVLVVAVADGSDLAGRLGAVGLLTDLEVRAVMTSRAALAQVCARFAAPRGAGAAASSGPPAAWSCHRRVPRLRRAGEPVPEDALARVPAAMAHHLRVVPLRLSPRGAVVVAHAPGVELDDLRFMANVDPIGVEAPAAAIDLALGRLLEAGSADAEARAPRSPVAALVGPSAASEEARAFVARLAPRRAPVAIVGEPGTDRAHVAHALHAAGARPHGPLLEARCRGVEPGVLLTELLGEAGAVERARGGTLVLRDADALPAAAQRRLLDALRAEARQLRLVLTLRRTPAALALGGAMDPALAASLAASTLALAPLRARQDDLEPLVAALIADAGPPAGEAWRLRPWAVLRLRRHAWPGNLDELRGVVASLVARRLARREGEAARRPVARDVVSASFVSADVRVALATIAAQAGRELRVADGVEGRVTVRLSGMPWRSALRLVARAAGSTVEERRGALVVRAPALRALPAGDEGVLRALPDLDVVIAVPVEEPVPAIADLFVEAPARPPARLTFDDDDPGPGPATSRAPAAGLARYVLEVKETFGATRVTLLYRDGPRVRRVSASSGADDRLALFPPERRLIETALAQGGPRRFVAGELGPGVGRDSEVLVLPLDLHGARHPGALLVEVLRGRGARSEGVERLDAAWRAPQVLEGLADLFATLLADALGDEPTPADDLEGPRPPAERTSPPGAPWRWSDCLGVLWPVGRSRGR